MMRYWFLVLVAVILLAGCATRDGPEPDVGEAPESEATTPTDAGEPGEPDDAVEEKPPVQELTDKARAASAAGDHARAARLLERALRVSPRRAGLWQNLAVVRYRQGQYAKAETLAQRSNRLSGSNQELRRRNWSLIEAARRKRGDSGGARQARERASELAKEAAAP